MPPSIKYLKPSLIETPLFSAIIKNIHSTMNKDITVSIFVITPVINIIVEMISPKITSIKIPHINKFHLYIIFNIMNLQYKKR